MNLFSLFVMYLIIWWIVLFAILPVGVKPQSDSGEIIKGTEPGAPQESNIKKKFILTSIISTVIWVLICGIIISGWFSWDVFGIFVKQNNY